MRSVPVPATATVALNLHANTRLFFAPPQLHKLRLLRDAGSCEVCGAPYQVPDAAWRAFAAAAGPNSTLSARLVALWQRLRPASVTALKASWNAARMLLQLRHWRAWVAMAFAVGLGPEDAPQLRGLQPVPARLGPLVDLNARLALFSLLLEYRLVRDWRAVLRTPAWREARRFLAIAALLAAAAAWHRRVDVPWSAAGAPAKQPVMAQFADWLLAWAEAAAAVELTRTPAFVQALLGPLAPGWVGSLADSGFFMLDCFTQAAKLDWKLGRLGAGVEALFEQRPAATRALHAALRAGG